MGNRMVYTCDICKNDVERNELITLKVNPTSRYYGLTIAGLSSSHELNIDICKECLRKKGFVVESRKEEEEQDAKKNQKTLEDKLYDILEDMGVAFQE